MTEDSNESLFISKTAKKKAVTALQKVGETLVKLNTQQLATIPLDDTLRAAIMQAQTMRTGNALRRQLQYIGKLSSCHSVQLWFIIANNGYDTFRNTNMNR